MNRVYIAACAALLALPAPLASQLAAGSLAVGASVVHERYDFLSPLTIGVRTVTLSTVPVAARALLHPRIGLELSTAFARGHLTGVDDMGDSDVELSGLTDTEVRANFAVIPDRLTVTAAILLPTGVATQTGAQTQLAGLVAADLLPFRISNWGTGGGLGLITTYAVPVGDFGLAMSAGYTVGREFEPIEGGDLAYRPGNELRVRLALDRSVGASGTVSLLLGAQHYANDQVRGESFFQPGNRVEALASYVFGVGDQSSGAVYAGVQHRGEGTRTPTELTTPAQDLINAGAGFRLPIGDATLVPAVDLRVFRRSDGIGQGALASVGSSAELPLAPGVRLVPALRTRFGEVLLWEGAETSVRGLELSLGLRVGA